MIASVVLALFGLLAATGAVATVLVTARDGYRRIPTRRV